ncbi:hypothetical protein [Streptomyces yatensis]|uniref:hypothetical protein n=1 Tax=Streptomyces yatensis TaxID=155177 RepID=UPI003CD070AA
MLASVSPESGRAFEPLGEAVAELNKFAALLVFDVPGARLFDVEDLVGIPDDDDEDGHDGGREKRTAGSVRTASRVEEDDDART